MQLEPQSMMLQLGLYQLKCKKMGLNMNSSKRSPVFEGQILNFFMFQFSYPEVLIALTLPKKNFFMSVR